MRWRRPDRLTYGAAMGAATCSSAHEAQSVLSTPLPHGAIPPLVERVRLDRHFAEGRGRLIRVVAPAGYGKTSLVRRWIATDDRQVGWIDLQHSDDDQVTLFSRLRDALAGIVDVPAATPIPAPSATPYVDALRSGLTSCAEVPPFVLVLDDVHRLRSPATGWLVDVLVEHLPDTSTIVLVGRSDHDHGSIGRFRLAPGVVELTSVDLSFDASESNDFLAAMQIDASEPELAPILDTLGGWPAGLCLVAGALRQGSNLPDVTDHVAVVEYLRDEWTAGLDVDDLAFLREVACLDRFTGAMCDEVLGRTESTETLRRLHRDDLVLLGLEQADDGYRLHGLVRRWLSTELREVDADRFAEVHRLAARFRERDGEIDRAVDHARACNDAALLEEIVFAHGAAFLTQGRRDTVGRWLAAFPPGFVRESPGLCAVHCIHAMHHGDEIGMVQWQRLLDDTVARRGRPVGEVTTSWSMLVAAALAQRPARTLLPETDAVRQRLCGGPWGAFACYVHGSLSFLDGELDDARDALTAGALDGEHTRNPMIQAHCLAALAVVDIVGGENERAREASQQATTLLRACGGDAYPTAALELALATLAYAEGGAPDQAVRQLATARTALVGFRSVAPWFNVIARIPLVRTALLLDDRSLATALLRELEHHARFELELAPHGTAFRDHLTDVRSEVDGIDRPATGAGSLSDAERRVLEFLPTNLSHAAIATHLYLSRNTVKSHAAAIYRKLGADNRTRAVELARAAGLLDERSGR